MDGLTAKYMDTIERLQSDKARLEVRIGSSSRRRMENMMHTFCLKFVKMCVFFFFIGESTDPGEGSKGVQNANRRVVRPPIYSQFENNQIHQCGVRRPNDVYIPITSLDGCRSPYYIQLKQSSGKFLI